MPDVVDLIMADHREVERLFSVLQKEPDQRPIAGPTVTALLIAHSRAEEAEVYPVARDEAGETDEVEHSQEEHAEAEELLEKLQATDPTSSQYEQILQKVVESVTHHVEDEEKTVLPGMRERLSDERREQLGEAFARARAEHLGDLPGEATREELVLQAKNSGIKNADNMTKAELKRKLQS
jgi:hemerythrin superfamily protein